jgi:undecaprenyl-diphosphatase
MTFVQALLLGIVQGLTEFLPISSSGHLVLVQHLFGLHEANLSFDVSVHVGTLAAVILFSARISWTFWGD